MDGLHSPFMHRTALLLAIYLSCVIYLTLNTVRIILVNRGRRNLAPLVGFVEVLIFLTSVGTVLSGPFDPWRYVVYAGGFASGIWVGLWLESRMAMGYVLARVMTQHDAEPLARALRDQNYGLTTITAQGLDGDVRMLMSVMPRRQAPDFVQVVRRFNPNAFVTVEDVRSVRAGYIPPSGPLWSTFLRRRTSVPD